MSYEGREFLLCEVGHLTIVSVYWGETDLLEHGELCRNREEGKRCGRPFILSFSVDDTNGEGEEPSLRAIEPARKHDCPECGMPHVISSERFAPSEPSCWSKRL